LVILRCPCYAGCFQASSDSIESHDFGGARQLQMIQCVLGLNVSFIVFMHDLMIEPLMDCSCTRREGEGSPLLPSQ
jgi:hypothetical protein